MSVDHIIAIFIFFLGVTSNGAAALLFWRVKRLDEDVEILKKELSIVRMNYLDRFDEIKTLLHGYHLQSIEKISILETLLKEHIKQ